MTTRCAFYLRVSSDTQTYENQRPGLEQLAATRGWKVVRQFAETMSAAEDRVAYNEMMRAAHRGEFDVIVVWKLDRFGRSTLKNIQAVLELNRSGVKLVSVQEPWLDTGGPVGHVLLVLMSYVAEQEREDLIKRTVAGIERARAAGTPLGRPWRQYDEALARELHAQGESCRKIAQRLKVPKSTIGRLIRRSRAASIPSQNPPEKTDPASR